MAEPDRAAAVVTWWRGLSGAWRANVGLYALATLALIALVVQVAVGGGRAPQRLEVASRAPSTTSSSARGVQPSTTVAPPTTAAPAPVVPGPTAAPAPSTPAPPAPLVVNPAAPAPETTIPALVCRNSVNPDCGPFSWDPAPPPDQPLVVVVQGVSPSASPAVGDTVTFTVTASDGDHRVTDNCAVANYGDGVFEKRGCDHPQCADAHGPWDPPPAAADSQTFTFSHVYKNANPYTATFTFHTDFDAPCPTPFGSVGQGQATLAVHA